MLSFFYFNRIVLVASFSYLFILLNFIFLLTFTFMEKTNKKCWNESCTCFALSSFFLKGCFFTCDYSFTSKCERCVRKYENIDLFFVGCIPGMSIDSRWMDNGNEVLNTGHTPGWDAQVCREEDYRWWECAVYRTLDSTNVGSVLWFATCVPDLTAYVTDCLRYVEASR